ncbi:MAG: class IV adenylate cyclase [Thermoguttaceae bacterium]|nr:class IV adenylate cyclase [Thermoguttaceae bacterium]
MLEVEVKYPVDDLAALRRTFEERCVATFYTVEEIDSYYNAPDRDFAVTDEAFRIRQRLVDGRWSLFLTYKGPKIDPATKTRREIDLPLTIASDALSRMRELFESLGYRPAGEVRKIRQKAKIVWLDTPLEISLDTLPQLQARGERGTFCELEIIAAADDLRQARSKIFELAKRVALPLPEAQSRLSYLGMILGSEKP